jgi:hypothetical protein
VRQKGESEMKTKKAFTFLVGFVLATAMLLCSHSHVQAVDGGEIHSGETKSGNIATDGQTDSYTFQGKSGQGIVVEMAADGNNLGTAFYLYRPDGSLETKTIGGYFDTRMRLEGHQLEQTGLYTIVTSASAGSSATSRTGKYNLSLMLIPGDVSSVQDPDGGPITSGQTRSGNITPLSDTDAFTFQGKSGQGFVVEMAADGNNLGTAFYLYRPDGSLETKTIGGYFDTRMRLEGHQLEQTGLYTIVTLASAGSIATSLTGKYNLSLMLIPGDVSSVQDPDGGPITSGQTRSGNITPFSDTDAFTFQGKSGQGIIVEMAADGSTLGTAFYLYRPDGSLEKKSIGEYGTTRVRLEGHQLEQTGLYTLVTSASAATNTSLTGKYNLSLMLIPGDVSSEQDPDGGPITSGQTRSGNITPLSDTDAFTFQGKSGQGIVVEMAADGSTLGTAFYLYRPDGSLEIKAIGEYGATRVRLEGHQLEQTGLYTIVTSQSTATMTSLTGKYNLSLMLIPGDVSSEQDPDGGPITSGQTRSGNITPLSDTDAFTFQGKSGQGIMVEMAADGSTLGTAFYLYRPDGSLETKAIGEYGATRVRLEGHQLEQTGLYTIVTSPSAATNTTLTGKFNLLLTLAGVSSVLPPGTTTPSTLLSTTSSSPIVITPPPTSVSPSAPPEESVFAASVPLPSQVSTDPKVVGTSFLLTILLIIIFYFAATLFNATFKENYAIIQNWGRRLRNLFRLKSAKSNSQSFNIRKFPYLEIIIIVFITAAINCAVDPGFSLSQRGLILFTAMVVTVIVSTYSYNGIRMLITKYRFHTPATIKAYPLAIILAILFVVISRLISFHPGFIFGFVGAFTILPSAIVLDKRQRSVSILLGAFGVIILAVLAFLLREPLSSATNGFWQSMLATILAALFVGGLERLLFGLFPLVFLDGGTLAAWKRLLWFILFAFVVFLFIYILIIKTHALTDAVKDMTVISLVGLALVGLLLSLIFWLYFRIRAKART